MSWSGKTQAMYVLCLSAALRCKKEAVCEVNESKSRQIEAVSEGPRKAKSQSM